MYLGVDAATLGILTNRVGFDIALTCACATAHDYRLLEGRDIDITWSDDAPTRQAPSRKLWQYGLRRNETRLDMDQGYGGRDPLWFPRDVGQLHDMVVKDCGRRKSKSDSLSAVGLQCNWRRVSWIGAQIDHVLALKDTARLYAQVVLVHLGRKKMSLLVGMYDWDPVLRGALSVLGPAGLARTLDPAKLVSGLLLESSSYGAGTRPGAVALLAEAANHGGAIYDALLGAEEWGDDEWPFTRRVREEDNGEESKLGSFFGGARYHSSTGFGNLLGFVRGLRGDDGRGVYLLANAGMFPAWKNSVLCAALVSGNRAFADRYVEEHYTGLDLPDLADADVEFGEAIFSMTGPLTADHSDMIIGFLQNYDVDDLDRILKAYVGHLAEPDSLYCRLIGRLAELVGGLTFTDCRRIAKLGYWLTLVEGSWEGVTVRLHEAHMYFMTEAMVRYAEDLRADGKDVIAGTLEDGKWWGVEVIAGWFGISKEEMRTRVVEAFRVWRPRRTAPKKLPPPQASKDKYLDIW